MSATPPHVVAREWLEEQATPIVASLDRDVVIAEMCEQCKRREPPAPWDEEGHKKDCPVPMVAALANAFAALLAVAKAAGPLLDMAEHRSAGQLLLGEPELRLIEAVEALDTAHHGWRKWTP